ncbi:nuclear transcription factor Y subunit gamma-like [Xenia sp. Carnegie-2017]|uniref:nuclear transcription factor Y subunit gamma-like n=1 Tax=Xenia sp. Carnegie-2017 TaxID=2897299 RepID=UPI001F03D1A3|nr:nuclear transcription factor Y subunit gamma-like [Xenia sp. Carnegie-2017]XP_046844374.1 nuclear transcription factor Y subunit gamma-like [Xenia sp. Carnegie-2017]
MMTDPVYSEAVPNPGQTEAGQLLASFWPKRTQEIRDMTDFKTQELPLARIKKIMKQDEEVKMISAEAPVLFAKAAEIFINELSLRAWVHTEDNKRRTLQRNDIAMAITKYDMFDFLIDIVPRDDLKPSKRQETIRHTIMAPQDQVQYYFQFSQQYQQPHGVQANQNQAQQLQVTNQPQAAIIGGIAQPQQGAVVVSMPTAQQQLIQTQQPDQGEATYQIPFPSSMQYINRIQQMATVQQIQQQQQVQPGQQTQQQTGTVQVQGVVTSQPQLGQAQVAQVQQGAMQAQQSQPGQQQVASQEIEQSSDAQNVRQTMTQASGTPQQYASFVGQIYQLTAPGQDGSQQVYIAATPEQAQQQAQQVQVAQAAQQTSGQPENELSQTSDQQQSQ